VVGGTSIGVDNNGDPIAYITAFGTSREALSDDQVATLVNATKSLTADDQERVDLGDGTGSYLVAVSTSGTTRTIVGVPTGAVDRTLATLIQLVAGGTLLGLVIVGVGGNWVIRRNLAPLGRVADTARKVSALKLDTGEVALPARVADRDTDPHTEVGQVGLALNRMLDNVEGALQTRHESEMRVRQFVADASHELRTPLASIRGYAELSRRETDPVPANVSHAIGRVESEALRMQGLVEDLLLLARLDSGRPLEREPVDVTLLAMDVVSDAHAAAPDHRWELDLPDEPVEAPGDRARLHQVLANLLANARTHTPAGTTVVTRIRREGQHVRIDVADNGPGIPADLQPRVFERFTRGDDSRNRASGSTGLGLSIVAAVAGAHAGRVDLASEPGRTVFTVWLPSDGPHSSNPIPQTQ
jgi:two-component system OmpR family sensor kinase